MQSQQRNVAHARLRGQLTVEQHPIAERVHGPHVWSPVCVTQTSGEREQPGKQLRYLLMIYKRSERECCYDRNSYSKLDAIPELNV